MNLDERVGKRHITELRRIRLEVQEKGDSSDDESFIQELMSERDRKMNRLKSLQEWQQSNHVSRHGHAQNHTSNNQLPQEESLPGLYNTYLHHFTLKILIVFISFTFMFEMSTFKVSFEMSTFKVSLSRKKKYCAICSNNTNQIKI